MRWWDSQPIHEPTTSANAVVVKRSPTVAETALAFTASSALPEGASEPQDEWGGGSGRADALPHEKLAS
eukprot:4659102-Prymnesium_polylepis.1